MASTEKTVLELLVVEYGHIVELWKFNRMFTLERYKSYFQINAGLLALETAFVATAYFLNLTFLIKILFILVFTLLGGAFSIVWFFSSSRHHQYVYQKFDQGVEYEKRINKYIEKNYVNINLTEPPLTMFIKTYDYLVSKKRGGKESTIINSKTKELKWNEKFSSSKIGCYIPIIFLFIWVCLAIALSLSTYIIRRLS